MIDQHQQLYLDWVAALATRPVDTALVASLEREARVAEVDLLGSMEDDLEALWPDEAVVAAVRRGWNPDLHPRGRDGRFLEKLGFVRFLFGSVRDKASGVTGGNGNSSYLRGQVADIVPDPEAPGSPNIYVKVDTPAGPRILTRKPNELDTAPRTKATLTLAPPTSQPVDADVDRVERLEAMSKRGGTASVHSAQLDESHAPLVEEALDRTEGDTLSELDDDNLEKMNAAVRRMVDVHGDGYEGIWTHDELQDADAAVLYEVNRRLAELGDESDVVDDVVVDGDDDDDDDLPDVSRMAEEELDMHDPDPFEDTQYEATDDLDEVEEISSDEAEVLDEYDEDEISIPEPFIPDVDGDEPLAPDKIYDFAEALASGDGELYKLSDDDLSTLMYNLNSVTDDSEELDDLRAAVAIEFRLREEDEVNFGDELDEYDYDDLQLDLDRDLGVGDDTTDDDLGDIQERLDELLDAADPDDPDALTTAVEELVSNMTDDDLRFVVASDDDDDTSDFDAIVVEAARVALAQRSGSVDPDRPTISEVDDTDLSAPPPPLKDLGPDVLAKALDGTELHVGTEVISVKDGLAGRVAGMPDQEKYPGYVYVEPVDGGKKKLRSVNTLKIDGKQAVGSDGPAVNASPSAVSEPEDAEPDVGFAQISPAVDNLNDLLDDVASPTAPGFNQSSQIAQLRERAADRNIARRAKFLQQMLLTDLSFVAHGDREKMRGVIQAVIDETADEVREAKQRVDVDLMDSGNGGTASITQIQYILAALDTDFPTWRTDGVPDGAVITWGPSGGYETTILASDAQALVLGAEAGII